MIAQKYDLVSQEFKRNPHAAFKKMRDAGPVLRAKLPLIGEAWLTTTYDATIKVLRDKESFVSDPRNAGRKSYAGMSWWMPRMIRVLASNMLGKDEPDHRRLRSLVESAFLRQSIDDMRPRIEELVVRQLDELEQATSGGHVDFVRHFARPFPLAVISELLGLPDEDRSKFMEWANFTDVRNVFGMIKALGGMRKLNRYLVNQFEQCRKQPRPGMISALVAAEQEGDRLSEEELLASAFVLLIAGHETTVHLLSGSLLTLLQHPEQKASLCNDWSKAEAAVDEVLRYYTPVQMTKPRYAARDIDLYGQRIKQGEFFTPLLAAANCDPAEFAEPERFDIDRIGNHHVGFGTGIHVCLGLKLAKAEVEIVLERLLTRFPDLNLAIPESELTWTERVGIRALRTMPVSLIR